MTGVLGLGKYNRVVVSMKTNAAQPNLHTDLLRMSQRSAKIKSEILVYNTSEAKPQAGEETVRRAIRCHLTNKYFDYGGFYADREII
jgi:hypothetical protein